MKRRLSTLAAYVKAPARSQAAHDRVIEALDAYERDRTRGRRPSLSRYSTDKGTTLETFKKYVPTRRGKGGRLEPATPGKRRLYRGTTTMLANIDGRPQIVEVTPSNDAQMRSVQGHDSAVFAAVMKDDDSGLPRYRTRVVVDVETGQRFRFAVDGDAIREVTDTGEVELQELYYSGGRRHDLDALLDEAAA